MEQTFQKLVRCGGSYTMIVWVLVLFGHRVFLCVRFCRLLGIRVSGSFTRLLRVSLQSDRIRSIIFSTWRRNRKWLSAGWGHRTRPLTRDSGHILCILWTPPELPITTYTHHVERLLRKSQAVVVFITGDKTSLFSKLIRQLIFNK